MGWVGGRGGFAWEVWSTVCAMAFVGDTIYV